MSPEIQNRGTSGSKIGHVYVSSKNIFKENKLDLMLSTMVYTENRFQYSHSVLYSSQTVRQLERGHYLLH